MRRFSVILEKKSEVGGQRSAGAQREDLLRAMYVGAAGAVLVECSSKAIRNLFKECYKLITQFGPTKSGLCQFACVYTHASPDIRRIGKLN